MELVRLVQGPERLPAVRGLVGPAARFGLIQGCWPQPLPAAVLWSISVLVSRGPVQPPSVGMRKIGRQQVGAGRVKLEGVVFFLDSVKCCFLLGDVAVGSCC
jgi:hypothetical protein